MGNIKFQNEDDYTQSANSLFHFMNKLDYLKNALKMKALVPRYCEENIEYLNLQNNDKKIENIWILEKCFCDIPFHKVFEGSQLAYNLDSVKFSLIESSDADKEFDSLHNKDNGNRLSHLELYGYFGLGFSKFWGVQNLLEPVSYVANQSERVKNLSNGINAGLSLDNLDDTISHFLIHHLCFIKPLKGKMKRMNKDSNKEVEVLKNFHDEREWRYVPSFDSLESLKLYPIQLSNKMKTPANNTNNLLEADIYEKLWLKFSYDDIRYIFVGNKEDRLDLIDSILELNEKGYFIGLREACLLISKIVVLSELRGDI